MIGIDRTCSAQTDVFRQPKSERHRQSQFGIFSRGLIFSAKLLNLKTHISL